MKHAILRAFLPAMVLGIGAQPCEAQVTQSGTAYNSQANGVTISQLQITCDTVPLCPSTKHYNVGNPGVYYIFPSTADYFTLPAGNGDEEFEVSFDAQYASDPMHPLYDLSVYVDGQYSPSYLLGWTVITVLGSNPGHYGYRIGHFGNAWSHDGVKEFVLRFTRLESPNPVLDIRFNAVVVGTTYTEVLGYYNAPSLPLFILRDPPGDGSFSDLSTSTSTCFGQSHSVNAGQEQNAWYKAKIGVAGEAGLFVTSEFELYFEGGVNVTASQSQTSEYEYETCLGTTVGFATANNGTPDDLYIGSAIRYAYGMAQTVERPSCGTINKYAHFASTPVQRLSSYHYTESYIIETIIPDMEEEIAAMSPGPERDQALNQLGVWHQALAMNASIKANAPMINPISFNGGDAIQDYSEESTTSTSRAIEYTAILENGLDVEMAVEAGGTGLSAGGSMKMRTEYGNGETNSNETTNTVGFHLDDADVFDNFTLELRRDNVFGGFVFILDSAESRTSCRYEGGYALDQPSLSVGSPGNTSMTVNEAPIGSAVNFPLVICNNSDTTRTYFLRFSAVTNAQGAHLEALGTMIDSNDDGIALEMVGGQCITTNLILTQPNPGVLDFPNINLYLYSLCDEEYPPYIRSYITISAHYGAGNFGDICEPVSAAGTLYGDFIDGVQLGAINNTGTGAVDGPTYTNYSAQFSTPLSRGAQQMITITSGAYPHNGFAAWIDYDHDGAFSEDEKLGAIESSGSYQPYNIFFTVPANANLGSAIMRVRSTYGVDPATLDACFNYDYGETEDYAVVINANTPQDCQGVNNGTALPGSVCNDGNVGTGNDAWNANCVCIGIALDCAGVPGGTTLPGSACDDGNVNTAADAYDNSCVCVGLLIDCLGVVGGGTLPGSSCDDGDPATGQDVYAANCQCAGALIDCEGIPGGAILPGTLCDDGNPLSGGDAYNASCLCVGLIALDCNGVENGTAQPGTACDDGDATTGNDLYAANCVCLGEAYDCAGTPGGTQLPGTTCDDANPNSLNDVFTVDCACVGQLSSDCEGVPGGTAQPGTACDDGDATTGEDTYNAFCQCIGQLIDCEGTPGGQALTGFPCDDGDETTGNDTWNAGCECLGIQLDCEGVVGGTNVPGAGCNDGNPETTNDIYNLNCVCVGMLALDCEGVLNGPSQPGTPCDDGNADTGDDTYDANCTCLGLLLDCEGTPGGGVLPGTTCDDGENCTANDTWDNNCNCTGTASQVGVINGPIEVEAGESITLFIDPIAGASGYSWDLPAGWSSDNTGTFVLVADAGSLLGPLSVCVNVTVNGCVITGCVTVTVTGSTGVAEIATEDWFTVRPNPSNGLFNLVPGTGDNTPLTITVYDATGREVLRSRTLTTNAPSTLDLSAVEVGTYYLMATREGEQRMLPLVVAH